MPEDLTIKSPVILDSTGLAIASALEKVAFLPQIVDNLTTADPTKPLSANMGKKLNDEKYEKPSTGIPATDLDSDVQASLGKADTAVQPEDIKPGAKYTSVTIDAADWSNGVCTKTVRGMNSNYVIILSADTNSVTDYIRSDIKCVAQGTNSLTFSCGVTPTNSVTVSVLCFETEPLVKPTSLTISGDWTNTQYVGEPVDSTGLTFTAEYSDGITSTVTPTSISPANWDSTVGTQTATFNYTEGGITVSASKAAEVEESESETSIPLTLKAAAPGNVSITKTGTPGTIYYSVNGVDQGELASNTNVPVNTGDRVSFYRTLSNDLNYNNYFTINCTNDCYVYGNVMSLYSKNSFSNLIAIAYDYAFYNLFYQNTYIDINESAGTLVLPATTLADYCYESMFEGCSSLTTAPTLPATTLAEGCYSYMFGECENLTSTPSLPATTLAKECYAYMFYQCYGLENVPSILPATTLAEGCYKGMFQESCAEYTYFGQSPILPAQTLVKECYAYMFYQCAEFYLVTCLATDISAEDCVTEWLGNVDTSGTFRKASSMNAWEAGVNIPNDWLIEDYQG